MISLNRNLNLKYFDLQYKFQNCNHALVKVIHKIISVFGFNVMCIFPLNPYPPDMYAIVLY